MRIACPACAAAYEVPDRLLAGPARTLRCSRCGADFALPQVAVEEPIASPAIEAAPPPSPSPEVAPEPRPVAAVPGPPPTRAPRLDPAATPRFPAPAPPSPALARAWAASIVVVLAAIVSLLVFHAKVMEAWPASTRLFAALGLA